MRSFDNWLDRFCRRFPGFALPNLMMYVVLGNVLVYCMDQFSAGTFSAMLCFSRAAILRGELWRLVTFLFVPEASSNLLFFALSLYFYYFIGGALEQEWGSQRFTVFYAMGVLLTLLTGLIAGSASMTYVNLSLFFAFATLYPDTQFLMFFFLPVKAKWLAWLDAVLFGWGVVSYLVWGPRLYALIPIVAMLNYILFFWQEFARRYARLRRRTSRQSIQFQKAQKAARQSKGYLHKCAVCGKTDTDFPELEFRYCSKCSGYHCYCMEHIHDHVHIQ